MHCKSVFQIGTQLCFSLLSSPILECAVVEAREIKDERITFVANSETMGNGSEASTMDYFQGVQYPHLSLILPYLEKMNQSFEVVNWQDETIDWAKKKKIILGPVWGYTRNINQFTRWLELLESKHVNMINAPKFLKWNVNKHYLLDLKRGEIPIPDTLFIEPSSKCSLDRARALFQKKFGHTDFILKGVIDAGGFGYMHVRPDNLNEARIHFKQLQAKNCGVIIQKFIPEIYKKGELSFVFLGGKMSHFFLKVPQHNEERVQPFYGGRSFHFRKNDIAYQLEEIRSNFRCDLQLKESEVKRAYAQVELIYVSLLSILNGLNIPHPKYLRVDGVMVDNEFVIMELEGIEPYLEIKEAMICNPLNNIIEKYINNIK